MKGKAARTFEELHIYQRARELTNEIYGITRNHEFSRDAGLVDQVRRAAVSVMSNIAEGFERGGSAEFIQFLYIAKGSCGEVRAQLRIACDQEYIGEDDHERLKDLSKLTSGMISNFIAHLQSSDYQGEKSGRPRRKALEQKERRIDDMRNIQQANIKRQKEREKSREQKPDKPEEE